MKCYKLIYKSPKLELIHEPFKDDGKAIYFWSGVVKGDLPDPFYCYGNVELTKSVHFPRLSAGLPVMSKQMLEILLAIEDFKIETKPLYVIDNKHKKRIYGKADKFSDFETYEGYFIFKLSLNSEVFDFDNSVYKPSSINPNRPGVIKKLVFKTPASGRFPPIFSLLEATGEYISEEAKERLEANKIFLNYIEIPVSSS